MDTHDRVLRIVGDIYATVGYPDRWPACLEAIQALLQGSSANLIFHDHRLREGVLFASTLSPEANDAYSRHYHAVDPWALNAPPDAFVPERVFVGQKFFPHGRMVRTEFYTDFAQGLGATRAMFGVIDASPRGSSGVLSLNRPDASPEFDEESMRILAALVPHVRRALALHRELALAGAERQALSDVLDQLNAAVVLVSEQGRVVLMNRAASGLARARDGFGVDRHTVVGTTANATTALRVAIRSTVEAARGQSLAASAMRVQLPRHSGGRALEVQIFPLPQGAHGAAAAALFITDPDATPSLPKQLLAGRFGLTPTESKVANALAQGLSVKAIAAACRLSTETTRWYVKQVLAKTGTTRQAEVVRLLLSLMTASVSGEER